MATMPHLEIYDTEYRSARDERVKRNNKIRDVKYAAARSGKSAEYLRKLRGVGGYNRVNAGNVDIIANRGCGCCGGGSKHFRHKIGDTKYCKKSLSDEYLYD